MTARGQATNDLGLPGRRRERRARQHRVHERAIEHARAFAAARLRATHDRLLVGEQIARRKPPLSDTGGTVHVVAREELRRGALDGLGRCPLPVRGRPRHHRLALRERVLPLGQPARPDQLAAHQIGIGNLSRPRPSTHQRVELARAEAVLGRPCTHDVTPRRGIDCVGLRDRVACAIASRPPSPTSTPAATRSRSRSTI